VYGLGTEALQGALPPARCGPAPALIEGWLPHAVVAAEDQRFHQHPGYDLAEWLAAWQHNTAHRGGAPLGASTLTQQLAKLLFTGGERSSTRKLREWLYAVEMERTLGKGRILQLYLAAAPWGDGVCGAEAAARQHLGRPTARLTPREAAWLASLLHNPDRALQRWRDSASIDTERAAFVLNGMARLPPARKRKEIEALQTWQPAPRVLP
jgi:membrane peptidoglycan carboxypeptidase